MSKKNENKIDFIFDKDRQSSLVLVIGKIEDFPANKFLSKYYQINPNKDEGESQSWSYLNSIKTIKKQKGRFSFGYDYVEIKSKDISLIIKELIDKNFDEVWHYSNSKFLCVTDFNSQTEDVIKKNLETILGDTNIQSEGVILKVVAF
jgi:hypothetical protein